LAIFFKKKKLEFSTKQNDFLNGELDLYLNLRSLEIGERSSFSQLLNKIFFNDNLGYYVFYCCLKTLIT